MLSVHCGPEKTMSSNSMQKPTRVLHTHAHLNKVRMSVYTPMSIYYFLHSNDKLNFLRFQWIESQALVNAFVAFSIRRLAFFYFSNYMSCRICACLFHAWNSLLLSCSQQIRESRFYITWAMWFRATSNGGKIQIRLQRYKQFLIYANAGTKFIKIIFTTTIPLVIILNT